MTPPLSPQKPQVQEKDLSNNIREIDPNVLQNQASDPHCNVWVGASAGTGKTKVLTDRVLRLLLPRHNGEAGTAPLKILCLTFTKAGASEMALRINQTLSRWTLHSDETLEKELQKLYGTPPTQEQKQAARKLFASIVDIPGGIQIMTIHAFCQSVLARFPLEAGLSPNFQLLDEMQAAEKLTLAMHQTLKNPDTDTQKSIEELSHIINEDQFFQLLKDAIKERNQLRKLKNKHNGLEGLFQTIRNHLKITEVQSLESFKQNAFTDIKIKAKELRTLCSILATSDNAKDQERLDSLHKILTAPEQERYIHSDSFISIFLTTKNEPRKSVLRKAMLDEHPDLEPLIQELTNHCLDYIETENRLLLAISTENLLKICDTILSTYKNIKDNHAAIDFDDLIIHTHQLLENKNDAQWVLFKLDQQIEHVLVDEAQDTNPDQWGIINALCEEFYTTIKEEQERTRTLFVVGDEKQSIYSFQRASPEEFERMRKNLKSKAEEAQSPWNDIALNISFRTSQAVLSVVDKVFEPQAMHKGLGGKPTQHQSFRRGQEGLVEIWPIFESQKNNQNTPETENKTQNQEQNFWQPPTTIIENTQSGPILADYISKQIASWIKDKTTLPSRDRPIKAGDIMILFRTRTALTGHLMRALKSQNVPVAGADRMILSEQIIIQDLLALANFCLLPSDDLTLAVVLKSPIIGISEAKLYDLAYQRTGTLWDVLTKSKADLPLVNYLKRFINLSKTLKPLDFFQTVLQENSPTNMTSGLKSFRHRLGDECLDPLQEFLDFALDFEYDNIPTLQNFVHAMQSNQTTLKREMESNQDAVRIMTVHASKGLQAPIVILPDTVRNMRTIPGQADKRLLWPSETGLPVPLWSPNSAINPAPYKKAYDLLDARLDEEYRRLLYVAMTRAEDRLYIAGHTSQRKPLQDSWYYDIENALKSWDKIEKNKDGTLRYSMPQTQDPDRKTPQKAEDTHYKDKELPKWVETLPAKEAPKHAPFRPSQGAGPITEEPATLSPLKQEENKAFIRGNIIHTLLQFLPDINVPNRPEAALNYLNKNASALTNSEKEQIIEEIFNILENPAFAPFFSENSKAEVSITGKLPNGQTLSGQIDRLVINDDSILILDFKTNRPPPTKEENVPTLYREQLAAYKATLKAIYPDKPIRTALLWTYTLQLMELNL